MPQSLIFLILVTVVLAATPDGDNTPGLRKSPRSVETVANSDPKRFKFGFENTTAAIRPTAESGPAIFGSAFGGPMRRVDTLSPTEYDRYQAQGSAPTGPSGGTGRAFFVIQHPSTRNEGGVFF